MEKGNKVREIPFRERALRLREIKAEVEAVEWLLRQLAGNLPAECPTALAIRRHSPWREILAYAWADEAFEVVGLLQDAIPILGPEMPSERLGC